MALSLTIPLPDATVDIAVWSCIENGLGISAASLATLRPLLRKIRGTSNAHTDSFSSHMISGPPSSKPRRLWSNPGSRGLPLNSIDQTNSGDLRPDKTAGVVTTIHSGPEDRDNSEEYLNKGRASGERDYRVLEVHQTSTFEIMTASTSAPNDERVPREHV